MPNQIKNCAESITALACVAYVMCACTELPQQTYSEMKEACELTLDGKTYFMGEEHCYRQHAARTYEGIWITGFEYSAFYRSNETIPDGYDKAKKWLDVSEKETPRIKKYLTGQEHVLRVKFRGIDPGLPGWYGHLGTSERGILVEEFLSIEQLQ